MNPEDIIGTPEEIKAIMKIAEKLKIPDKHETEEQMRERYLTALQNALGIYESRIPDSLQAEIYQFVKALGREKQKTIQMLTPYELGKLQGIVMMHSHEEATNRPKTKTDFVRTYEKIFTEEIK